MGVLKNLYRKLLKKEETYALPEGVLEEVDRKSKQDEFKAQISNVNIDGGTYEDSGDGITYNPRKLLDNPAWQKWYTDLEDRNKYFSENKSDSPVHISYKGALAIMSTSETENKIMLNVIDDVTNKPEKVEVGRVKGKKYAKAMHEMDTILTLQISGIYKGELLDKEIQRHYNELKKIKGLDLSILGEQIFLDIGKNPIFLENVNEENLYSEKVDFTELPKKDALTEMPVICKQFDTQEQSAEVIDEKVEAFCRYCNLAIDIGVFGKEDWQKIDETHSWLKKRYNKKGNDILYNRASNYRKESYNEIKFRYLTNEQLQDLRKRKSESMRKVNLRENIDSVEDIEEQEIRNIVKSVMTELPIELEECILEYQSIHENETRYNTKINLLRDMNNYAKIRFLEERGIGFGKDNSRRNNLPQNTVAVRA